VPFGTIVLSIKGRECLVTFSKFSILSSSFKVSDLLYESNFEISIPPQNGQVGLLSETLFWHLGFRQRAMTQMLIIGAHAVPLETVFTGNFRIDMGESEYF